ncbi:MAG: LPS export ABC transporter permease LptF [Pseudomonadota bacterium]
MRKYIIERYVAREALLNFLAVISVLLLIYVSNRFIRFLAEAAAGDIDSQVILELLVLKLTANSVLLLPLALYVGVLLALGRLYRDSEVVAMHAGGIGFTTLLRAIGALAVVFAGLTAILSLYVAPAAAERADSLTSEARSDSEMTGLYPGRFKEFSDGDQIIYAEDVAVGQNRMETVFVQVRRDNALDLVFARTAHQFLDSTTGDRFMVLESGYRYEGHPGAPNFVIHEFKTHGVRIRKREVSEEYRPLEVLSLTELLASDTYTHLAELQWRLSVPISAFVLALLAVPLSRTSSREGKYGKLFVAVLIYFIYTNLMSISQKAVERGELTPLVGVWPVHVLMLLVVLCMVFVASGGWSRLRARMRRRPHMARTY